MDALEPVVTPPGLGTWKGEKHLPTDRPLALSLLSAITCLAVAYLLVVQVIRTGFYRKRALR